MRRKPLGLPDAPAAIRQIVGKGQQASGEFLEIAGQANIARVPPAEDDPRRRVKRGDDPEHENVVGHLVDDPLGSAAHRAQALEVTVGGPAHSLVRPPVGGPSAAAVSPIMRSSPAPNTREWLAAICSTRLVPERGKPTIKTGTSDGLPQTANPGEEFRCELGDAAVDGARQFRRVEAVACLGAGRAVKPVRPVISGEGLLVLLGIIERLAQREPGAGAFLGRQVGPFGERGDAGDLGVGRGQFPAGGEIAVGIGEIGIERDGTPISRHRIVETPERVETAPEIVPQRGIAGAQRQCFAVPLDGAVEIAHTAQIRGELAQHRGEIEACFAALRIERNSTPGTCDSRREIA